MDGPLEKLDLSETQIDVVKLFELKSMKKLKLLELRGYNESDINIVKKKLPNIEIVQNSKNVIASDNGFQKLNYLTFTKF